MVFTFRLTITSEPQQLPKVMPRYEQVRLSTPSGNVGSVYLSGNPANSEAPSNRFAIPADARFPLRISDLSLLWAYGTASDVLDLLCETSEGGLNEPSTSN